MGQGRVLVTGAAGLLGHWLLRSAPHDEVVALTHRRSVTGIEAVTADLRDRSRSLAAVAEVHPTLIVHAAYAKDRESIVDATRHVVEASEACGADVVFISSDAVFLGDGVPRDEQSEPDATWDYGRWKAAAERAVLDGSDHGAVVRLPLLVSIDPDDHMVRQLRTAAVEAGVTPWFADELRRPALASEVAAAIWRIAALPAAERRGCWHLAGAERLSRLELARRLVDRLQLPHSIIESATQPKDRPRDIAFTDARARDAVAWRPSPIA